MRTPRILTRLAAGLALAAALAAPALAKERSEIPDAYKWDLTDLYKTEADWEAARARVAAGLPQLAAHRGHLGDSAAALLACLQAKSALELELTRLYVYASSRSDEDTRAARPRELRQGAQRLAVELGAATAWIQPELLALDAARVSGFLAQEPRLAPWRFFIEDTLRGKPHTLDAAGEELLAEAGNLTGAGAAAYGILKDADLPYPTVKLSTGEVRLDPAAFALHRASPVKADRDLAFERFFGAIKGYERTFGTTLDAAMKAHLFNAKARKFPDTLSASLFRANVPTAVYTQLIADVRRSLPTFHRYLKLRQRMLGLEKLRYQDLYVPMVGAVDLTFGPEEARRITLDAFAPLGKPYVAALQKGYESRWTDFLPSTGKRAGAYSTGVYGVHPYQLLNFNGQYDDLSTLAHESGHSMHTFLAYQKQPFETAEYPIFVAEVASTLNENLLLHHMLGKAKKGAEGDATRLALLGNYLDNMRATLFRQTSFAEFELEVHRRVEKGQPVTGEALSALYLKLVRDYYGHDAGVCQVDDLVGVEWAYVPHFYYDYYVFQYATSLVASTSIAKAMRDEAKAGKSTRVRDGYLAMLAAGGSKYPVDLLKEAGVDMTTSRPFDAAIAEMNGIMDEMEGILARQAKAKK
ncbi:MAG TPA: oligoendopeptidase F [Anaeromyxobacteraceae bacterium]|nr:oligoendopeptidase F [Anaeromyxobacteraceae bacterium]